MERKKKILQEVGAEGTEAGVEQEIIAVNREPFDPDSISIEPKVVPMDTLLRRLRQGTIRLAPSFQRKYVWDVVRSSQLIESLMLRIPLPMFYVSANADGTWDVVDGLQRLTTIRNFLLGEELDEKNKKAVPEAKPFALKDLEFWGERFDGLMFSQIANVKNHALIVNNIMETEMRFTVINPGTPEEVKRNIFKRINTGGMPLTPQEIRHALYQGTSTEMLSDLAEAPAFKRAIGFSVDDSRMAARELILRFLAFSIRKPQDYLGDMDQFLSDTMRLINSFPDITETKLKQIFRNQTPPRIYAHAPDKLANKFILSMERCHSFFGNYAFRKAVPGMRRTPINKALFESWSNIFSNISDSNFQTLMNRRRSFFNAYEILLDESEFDRAISRDSTSVIGTRYRYRKLKELTEHLLERK